MPWLRLRVAVPEERADEIDGRLRGAGAVAVSILPGETAGDVLEPPPDRAPLWSSVRVEGLFPVTADLSSLTGLECQVDFVPHRDWSETWREGIGPLRFGRLLVLPTLPEGNATVAKSGEVVLRLDPGLAFGTGTHVSTALCLEWLAERSIRGRRVLDVGSGSGILAIAACLLGGRAVAVDHDAQARRATLANARRNGVDIEVVDDLEAVHDRHDVVLANLVADTIRTLAGPLTERLAPGGDLVLSGILASQTRWVMAAFSDDPHCRFEPPVVRDGWALLHRCPNPNR
ncbi:MAG: 50S ribosomal protein L11 methyltransferase [Gammaproteobacteria bacterium]|nr:50S ribosomal protein L11 methyltransferase [Gammaproteobacteria bacterium]